MKGLGGRGQGKPGRGKGKGKGKGKDSGAGVGSTYANPGRPKSFQPTQQDRQRTGNIAEYFRRREHTPRPVAPDDDHPFIVLTETKFSFRCIPVWIGTLL